MPFAYFKDPDRSSQVFRVVEGQRYSICGDYARVEPDGTVVFLGRGSLCINTAGEKVYPEEVEDALRSHPAVRDANVVGIADEVWNEAVTAVVALHEGQRATEEEMKEAVRDRLAGYKVPKRVVFVTEIPRSPAGKAQYDWAKRMVSGDEGSPG
jgi:3-oxocholest-4-en-26-oate---CoA ligase